MNEGIGKIADTRNYYIKKVWTDLILLDVREQVLEKDIIVTGLSDYQTMIL